MAKSKSGGTRSYIRGRVGADVYSIGRDAKGAKQQVVRSLAETVANPQTVAQMRGRMIMSTVMQAVSAMRQIIDHSFDNVPTGQPCISEFISRNYSLIKADIAANPNGSNNFGLNKYQEKGVKVGNYIVSAGDVTLNANYIVPSSGFNAQLQSGVAEGDVTVGALRTALALGAEDFITVVGFDENGAFAFARLHIKDSLEDSAVISTSSPINSFDVEGVGDVTMALASGKLTIKVGKSTQTAMKNCGIIKSVKTSSGWKHNTCVLSGDGNYEFPEIVSLPTYPVGTEQFLNGGEL